MSEQSDTPRTFRVGDDLREHIAELESDLALTQRDLAAARADWLKAASSNVSLRDDLVVLRADRDRLAAENAALKRDGMVMVPREPTEAMMISGDEAIRDGLMKAHVGMLLHPNHACWNVYRAMIDAALAQERKP